MTKAVLDSSAILAFVNREPGWEEAKSAIPSGIVSSLVYAEVVTLLALKGGTVSRIDEAWGELELTVEPFAEGRARAAGLLAARTHHKGLSLADRACLALAHELGLPVVTADHAWAGLAIGVDIRLIR